MAALRALARPCLIRGVGIRRMAETAGPATSISLTFGSPGEAFYKGVSVASVDVHTMGGHVGILPNHVPLLAALAPGAVLVKDEDGKEQKFFVSSGGLTINADSSVQILAEEAVPFDQLDAQAIKSGLDAARSELASAKSDKEVAEAEINVEAWEALSANV